MSLNLLRGLKLHTEIKDSFLIIKNRFEILPVSAMEWPLKIFSTKLGSIGDHPCVYLSLNFVQWQFENNRNT